MGEVSTIGLDIAKNLFQIHGVDADGTVVIRKRVSRARVLRGWMVGLLADIGAHPQSSPYPVSDQETQRSS